MYSNFFNSYKKTILFIHGFQCYLCATVSKSNHLHHNDKNRLNDDFFNLVPLCNHHHKMIHQAYFVIDFKIAQKRVKLLEFLYKICYIVQ